MPQFNLSITATGEQMFNLALWCSQNGITVSGDATANPQPIPSIPSTPFTNRMIGEIADEFNMTLDYIQSWLTSNNITSCEQAAAATAYPEIADYIRENFLD